MSSTYSWQGRVFSLWVVFSWRCELSELTPLGLASTYHCNSLTHLCLECFFVNHRLCAGLCFPVSGVDLRGFCSVKNFSAFRVEVFWQSCSWAWGFLIVMCTNHCYNYYHYQCLTCCGCFATGHILIINVMVLYKCRCTKQVFFYPLK